MGRFKLLVVLILSIGLPALGNGWLVRAVERWPERFPFVPCVSSSDPVHLDLPFEPAIQTGDARLDLALYPPTRP